MDELEARIAELREQEELDSIRPPLDGRQVMDVPRRPARAGSSARRSTTCSRLRLDEGPIDEADAFARLAEWARERGIAARGP